MTTTHWALLGFAVGCATTLLLGSFDLSKEAPQSVRQVHPEATRRGLLPAASSRQDTQEGLVVSIGCDEASLDKLEVSIRGQIAVLNEEIQALTPNPVPWDSQLVESRYQEENLRATLEEQAPFDILDLDCDEYPCIAAIAWPGSVGELGLLLAELEREHGLEHLPFQIHYGEHGQVAAVPLGPGAADSEVRFRASIRAARFAD